MRLKHRRLICIITSFIMAVTVFGCTSLTFATEGENDETAVENDQPTSIAAPVTDADNDTPTVREGSEGDLGDQPGEEPPDDPEYAIDAPGSLQAVGGNKQVDLSWDAVGAKYGGAISYEIYSSADDTAASIATVTETAYTIPNLAANTYTYYISAVETIGSGEDAVVVKSVKAAFSPAKVIDFSAQCLTGLRSDPGYRAVLLEWYPVEGATGYLIFRRQGGERGNTDANCIDSDGHRLTTFKSSKSKGYGIAVKPGNYTLIKDYTGAVADSRGKINYRDGGLQDLNMTYVYFYQYMIVPYYKDAEGTMFYCKGNDRKQIITKDTINTAVKNIVGTNVNYNIVKNNTVLPMYILYRVKKAKPYYRTNSMGDGKKMGRLSKGTYYIGFDKKDGRDRFYMQKSGTTRTEWWFAQKNANVVQGYYLNNGNSQDLARKDWQTGYSKKTVLDFVNYSGLSSSTGYLIWVSKYAQHAYIFTGSKGHWRLINNGDNFVTTGNKGSWSNLCASGKVLFNSRNNNGPIKGKQYAAKRKKYWYYNLSKLHPTERLHSVLYKRKAPFGSGKYYDRTLGSPKSNGCIRLKPGASQFIYKYAPKGTKAFVY